MTWLTVKSKNLLGSGLTSELFLLAFFKPDSGYRLAQRLQNTKSHPETSKIYPALTSLTTSHYLKHFEKKYYPNFTKLLSDITAILKLKKKSLNDDEKKIIELILKYGKFFGMFSLDMLLKLKKQQKGVHHFNALEIICNKIGEWSTICLFLHSHNPNFKNLRSKLNVSSFQDFESIFNDLSSELSDIPSKINPKIDTLISEELKKNPGNLSPDEIELVDMVKVFVSSIPSFVVFNLIPNKTLKKLSLLWTQRDGFNLGIKFMQKFPKEKHKSRKSAKDK